MPDSTPPAAGRGLRGLPPVVRFAIVGVIGYFVDAGVFSIVVNFIGPLPARGASFLLAATTTFLLNRWYTFDARGQKSLFLSYGLFLLTCLAGGSLNILVSWLLMRSGNAILANPFVAIGAGSLSGMAVNYTVSKLYIFKGHGPAN